MAITPGGQLARSRLTLRRRRLVLAPKQSARLTLLLAAGLVVGLTASLAMPVRPGDTFQTVGQPAPRDYVAPRRLTYVSSVLTERERQRAADSVQAVYGPPDAGVATTQAMEARQVLAFIEVVRDDPRSSLEEKVQDLAAVPALAFLSDENRQNVALMDAATWALVQREVPAVVSQALRAAVRPDGLAGARSSTVAFVERAIDSATAALVAQIAAGLLVPNTYEDPELTEAARQAARGAVEPVQRTVAAGQTVVREGDILTEEAIETLEQLGLLRGSVGWRDLAATAFLVLVVVATAGGSLLRLKPGFWRHPRRMALTVFLVVLFVFGARFVIPDRLVLGYAYPAAAVAMTVTALLGLEVGILASLVMAVAIGSLAGANLEPTLYVLAGSLAGSIALGRVERLSAFVAAGTATVAANLMVIAAFTLPGPTLDIRGLSELSGAALANGVLATGLTAVGFLAAGSLGITTSLQLLELARPDHPLLRSLQTKAPGTYHHSIIISNLAEGAAQAIGADSLLARVGSYYHDVGKSERPYFFVENQVPGVNPHTALDPHASARIVLAHVPDGAELAERHGLPDPILDFIWQHHGTTLVEYFHHAAVESLGEENVATDLFRYPGPKPQTREAAILMLADGCEAAVRAANPTSKEEIREIVNKMIRKRLVAGELDESNLTLRDVNTIRDAFVAALHGLYHPRIRYPDDDSDQATAGGASGSPEPPTLLADAGRAADAADAAAKAAVASQPPASPFGEPRPGSEPV